MSLPHAEGDTVMSEMSMPRLSDTMQEGTISRWLKKAGDAVKKGDILAEIETDKANMEVESYESGILEQILVQEGETALVGQPIALIGSGASAQKAAQPATSRSEAKMAQAVSPASAAVTPHQNAHAHSTHVNGAMPNVGNNSTRIKVSPLARRIAEEHGIDLLQIQGTGPGGRIVHDDLQDYLAKQRDTAPTALPVAQFQPSIAAPAAQSTPMTASSEEVEIIPLTAMQKTIVRRLTEAKQTIPHIYISNEVDMTEALTLRQQFNAAAGEGDVKVSVNDLVIKACALALEKFPEINSSYQDGQFLRHKHINIGMAVDIPNGLVVPVVRDANIKGIRSIACETRVLAEKARNNKLTVHDMSGGTFSISNLGMMDVTEFKAIINPPEAAILAVGATHKAVVLSEDQPIVHEMMTLTISADHRVLSGAACARFLQEIKRLLQNPYSLLG
jgi:pyruvate dehydrogenase E2 component (dihydrolipoamide acetyltransferase)